MLYKIALCDITPLKNVSGSIGLIKTASGRVFVEPDSDKARRIEAEIKKHPTALFFRAKAIIADEPNSNGDYFSSEELVRAHKSFEGVPFFTNHDNQNIENARGKIIYAEWVPEEKAVYTISFVDREAFPHICRSIEEEYTTGVSMGAVGGDSIIVMSDLSEKKISEVVVGDEVLTPYGNRKKVKMVHNDYIGKSMYSFDLMTYHKTPKFTDDHPIQILEGAFVEASKKEAIRICSNSRYNKRMGYSDESVGQDTWRCKKYDSKFVHANKIQNGDYLLVPSKFVLEDGESYNSDFYYVVGAYLGDGYLKRDKRGDFEAISFCFGLNEIELTKKVTDILKKYSKAEPHNLVCEDRNGLYVSLYDRKLAQWFSDNVGTGSKNKRIKFNPKFKENAFSLLSGYLDTDGCISKKSNSNYSHSYQISSSNLSLLEDFQSLLISLDSVSRISSFHRSPGKNSIVKVNTIEHTLSIGSNNSDIFKNSIKFNNNVCKHAQIKAGKSFITEINGNKFMACPVKNIYVDEFNEPVYDITVEGDECYIADGIGVHNCSVEYSVCNICGNRAEKTEDYCSHIKERKGRKFSGKARDVNTGEVKEFKNHPVFEYNYGIKFIELSAVVDPACESCHIEGIIPNDDYLKKVANIENTIRMFKTSAIEKNAGQEEIQQLNQCLTTLETIAINLIQNRQQVEVEFASDLVGILSELQTFVDELVGAGYGNVQGAAIPGVAEGLPGDNAGTMPLPEATTPAINPAAEEIPAPLPSTGAGSVSGVPGKPLVQAPKLPITAPAKPMASTNDNLLRISEKLNNIRDKLYDKGEGDMAKRRTISERIGQKKLASEILSNSWQEKQEFFKYINKVPSIQNNNSKLSVRKTEDSFIVVAESKDPELSETQTWTYENLNDEERRLIKESPEEAALYLLNTFSNSLNTQKEGVRKMTDKIREAGANSVNKQPEVVQEAQLEQQRDLYHARENDERNVITEKQLEQDAGSHKRTGEQEVITEAQLNAKGNPLNPRTDEPKETITEAQLRDDASGISPRKGDAPNVITQKQLADGGYTNPAWEKDVVTEKQLDDVSMPWERVAKRDASLFKSAGDHMSAVVDVIADSSIATGCTPSEACEIAGSLVGSTKDRYELEKAILTESKDEEVDYTKRLAYWNKKNIKVAGSGTKEIAETIVSGLRKVASDETINPEILIDAMDVVSEDEDGIRSVSDRIDEKLESAKKETVKASRKSELREALKKSKEKEERDQERKEIIASVTKEDAKVTREAERAIWKKAMEENDSRPDTMIETSFEEIGFSKEEKAKDVETFKKTIKSFAKGALASRNVKLANIVNVTIDGETISIAVQTDEGGEGVEIPIGETEEVSFKEEIPEGDMTGEGLSEENLSELPPPPAGAVSSVPTPMASKKAKMTKQAQSPMGGGIPGTPGDVAGGSGAPEAGLPGPVPEEGAVGALTEDEGVEAEDEIPTAGEQQPLGTVCPECGTSDVDVTAEGGSIKGKCNNPECGAEYEALIKKEVEYKIVKPSKAMSGEEGGTAPDVPEVPALPVAAQTKLDKGVIMRIASNKKKYGHVCPACGMNQCKASVESEGHVEYSCPACGTDIKKDIIVNVNNPDENYLRVSWALMPNLKGCDGCEEEVKKFASMIRVQKMVKAAQNIEFPTANCKELIARRYGGNAVGTFGKCKGKVLADCICSQLEKLGLTKVRHMEKLAAVYTQKDPMDECIEDQLKKNFNKKEAETICGCLKKKFASEIDDNPFIQAFADDIKSGKEKILTAQDMGAINDIFIDEEPPVDVVDEDIDISDALEEEEVQEVADQEVVTIEVSKETAEELAAAATEASDEVEVDVDVPDEVEVDVDVPDEVVEDVEITEEIPEEIPVLSETKTEELTSEQKKEIEAMKSHKLRRVGDEVVKVAGTPKKVEDIEGDVKAGVPRAKATMGEEGADNIDVPMAKPSVPRAKATMGNESAENIDKPMGLPDVAVDNSYMGEEKSVQSGMPEINNEIKGTVIAKEKKNVKKAKQMKEVDTVEGDVEAGVPRAKATMGEEGADNIDVPMAKPSVPRANAEMGKEGPDNINPKATAPDVPVDNAYMGDEKSVQKDMPAINDEMLKQVQQKKEIQLERISNARRMKATEVAARLLATSRITEEAYGDVIDALSSFEIDKISAKAETMYPKKVSASKSEDSGVYAGPAIVMESKETKPSKGEDLTTKLASHFTVGNSSFDEKLTIYGDK